jgi:type II restriction enzyme
MTSAVAGLLFDVGSGRYAAPPRDADPAQVALWEADLQRVREESAAALKAWKQAQEGDATHTGMQGTLRDLGHALQFDVWVAANDRSRSYGAGALGDGCLVQLPFQSAEAAESVRLIDVVWFEKGTPRVAAAFEVEHSTSIYSGIVRMLDLALGSPHAVESRLFLVAPDDRRAQVAQQLRRPAFSRVSELGIRYLPYGQITEHGPAIRRFGTGLKPLMEISEAL